MYYIVQEDLFSEKNYNALIDILNKYKFDYEIVKFRSYKKYSKILFKTDRLDVFCFGAVKMAHIAKKYKWIPGSMMNENHDFEVYSKGFGIENMLNSNSITLTLPSKVPLKDFLFFARPTKDTKLFSGQVFTHESWDEMWVLKKENKHNFKNESVIVAPCKEIQQEVRCWVVGGKVITASRYKLSRSAIYKNYDDESFYIDFAQKMVDKYQPAEAFVIDICLVEDELKIVEINCINASGFYHCNLSKLINALENHFG